MAVDGISHGNFMHQQMHGDKAQSSVSGNFGSHSVEVSSSASSLADCAEEMTFVKDNSKKTKLEDRKQKNLQNSIEQQIAKLKETVKSVENADRDILKRLQNKWAENKSSEDDILEDLKNTGHSAASSYAELLNLAEETDDADLKLKLNNAAARIFTENKSQIQAALNTIDLKQPEFNTTGSLSLSYGEISTSQSEPLTIVKDLIEKYGQDNLQAGLDFMLKALACDLASINPSQDSVALENVGTNLSKAKHVGSALKATDRLLDRFESVHQIKDAKVKLPPAKLLGNILEMDKLKFVASVTVRGAYRELQGENPEIEVLMAQELLNTLRDMPLEIYDSMESRGRMIDGTRELIDNLVEKEEEWLAAGE